MKDTTELLKVVYRLDRWKRTVCVYKMKDICACCSLSVTCKLRKFYAELLCTLYML